MKTKSLWQQLNRDLRKKTGTVRADLRKLKKINVSVRSSDIRWQIRISKDTATVCSIINQRIEKEQHMSELTKK